jgi:hypothetical protein
LPWELFGFLQHVSKYGWLAMVEERQTRRKPPIVEYDHAKEMNKKKA